MNSPISGVARAPQAPRPRGARGAEGARQGPARRSSRRNPLARGLKKLFAGGPEHRRYATARQCPRAPDIRICNTEPAIFIHVLRLSATIIDRVEIQGRMKRIIRRIFMRGRFLAHRKANSIGGHRKTIIHKHPVQVTAEDVSLRSLPFSRKRASGYEYTSIYTTYSQSP